MCCRTRLSCWAKRGPRRRRRANGAVPPCTELARLCRACIQLSLAFMFQVSCHSSGLPRPALFRLRRTRPGKPSIPQSRQPASNAVRQVQRLACSRLPRTSAAGPARTKAMRSLPCLLLAEVLNPSSQIQSATKGIQPAVILVPRTNTSQHQPSLGCPGARAAPRKAGKGTPLWISRVVPLAESLSLNTCPRKG